MAAMTTVISIIPASPPVTPPTSMGAMLVEVFCGELLSSGRLVVVDGRVVPRAGYYRERGRGYK